MAQCYPICVSNRKIDGSRQLYTVFYFHNSIDICMSPICSCQCHWLVHERPYHVLSCLCDNACKRSITICRKSRTYRDKTIQRQTETFYWNTLLNIFCDKQLGLIYMHWHIDMMTQGRTVAKAAGSLATQVGNMPVKYYTFLKQMDHNRLENTLTVVQSPRPVSLPHMIHKDTTS